jgi:hypothetical protein
MATTQDKKRQDESAKGKGNSEESPFDDVKDALGEYISAMGSSLADKAGGAVGGLAGRLTDSADGPGGTLGRVAQRVLKGDSPLKSLVSEKAKSVKDNVMDKVTGGSGDGGSGGGDSGGSSIKATNIVEVIDIGVPLRTVYAQWTEFEDFSGITKGVRSVSQSDETTSDWNVKVGPSSRSWKATVQEQVPDERITWTSEGAKGSTSGAVTFHELAPSLTRIVVVVEYYPAGFFEKTGNLWRAQGRRLRLDLKHFARHVTLHADDDLEGWLGEIRDGEVVKSHEEFQQDEADKNRDDDDDDAYEDEDDGPEGYDEEDDDAPAEEYDDDGPYGEDDEDDDEEDDDDEDEGDGDEGGRDDRDDRQRHARGGRRSGRDRARARR